MIRVPSRLDLGQIQEAFRQVQSILNPLERGNFDIDRRRVTNAGDAVLPADYVTKRQMEDFILGIRKSNRMLLGGSGGGAPAELLVDWLVNGVFKATTRQVNFASLAGDTSVTISAPTLVSGLMEYFFKANPGGAIAPFTNKFAWDRAGTTQYTFDNIFVAGTPPGPTWERNVVTSQSSIAVKVTPYLEFRTSGPPAAHEDGFLYVTTGISGELISGVRQDLEFIISVGDLSVGEIDKSGFIIALNGSETDDYYQVGLTSTNIKLRKRIGGTYFTQGDQQTWAGPHSNADSRIRIVLTSGGRVRVFGPTNTTDMYDCPMTQGNSTIITSADSVHPGVVLPYRGSPVSMSFAIMHAWSVPTGTPGEQMRL